MRHYNWFDQIIARFEDALEIIGHNSDPITSRPTPKPSSAQNVTLNNTDYKYNSTPLSDTERQLSLNCMRVNHSGEVAAQALYLGQALVARKPELRKALKAAALEEQDHLRWCKHRIKTLGGRPSYLMPIWAIGSFTIGITAGWISDKISLSFLAETENQVMRHIDNHLNRISLNDIESRAILSQMREDEAKHASSAIDKGGSVLPYSIQLLMRCTAKIMTTTAFYL